MTVRLLHVVFNLRLTQVAKGVSTWLDDVLDCNCNYYLQIAVFIFFYKYIVSVFPNKIYY